MSRVLESSANVFRVAQVARIRECEQVAAVCYRWGDEGIEFLLVRTRGRRWTFPKGGVEPGLTHAQAAALEAFEEAGVHGRMEEAAFTRYERSDRSGAQKSKRFAVNAHLCEVFRLGRPQEANRNRTWFSAEKTKRRLLKDRKPGEGSELAAVVDRAVARIQRPRNVNNPPASVPNQDQRPKDALQKVQFEVPLLAGIHAQITEASFVRYVRRQQIHPSHSASVEFEVDAYLSKTLRRIPPKQLNGSAARAQLARVVEIDNRGVKQEENASRSSRSARNITRQ